MKIDIFGIISEDYWGDESTVSVKSIRKQLNALKDGEELTVYINSPGGSVFEGLAIYNLLAEKKPTIKIIGEASSIASVIACAGEKVMIAESALMLFHKPWTVAWGNENDFEKVQKQLTTLKDSIKTVYSSKSKLSDEKIEDLLNEDTYHSAQKCLELGFVDEIYAPGAEEIEASTQALKAMNKQFRKFYNLSSKNNFLNKGDNSQMDYQKAFQDLTASFEALQANHTALKTEKQEIVNQVQALTAEKTQLKEQLDAIAQENTKFSAQIAELKSKEIENQVKLDMASLSDKILPAENNADNSYALTAELLWLKGFDNDASAVVNGKSPYARKIAEISARASLNNLTQPLKAVVVDSKSINVDTKAGMQNLVDAALAMAKAENITYEEASEKLLGGIV